MDEVTNKCPWCGYIIPDELFFQAAYDYPCPRCNQKKLSQFRMVKNPLDKIKK